MTLERAVTEIVRPVEIMLGEGSRRWVSIPDAAYPSAFPLHRLDDVTLRPGASFPSLGSQSTELLYVLGDGFTYGSAEHPGDGIARGSVLVVQPGTSFEVALRADSPESGRLLRLVLPAGVTSLSAARVEVHALEESRVLRSAGTEIRPLTEDSASLEARPRKMLLHVRLWRGAEWAWSVPPDYRACVYVLDGSGRFGRTGVGARPRDLLLLGSGERFRARVRDTVEFLLVCVAAFPELRRFA